MTATALDLGNCGALLEGAERCPGHLIVQSESDGYLEARCDRCGTEAVCPPGARRRTVQDNDAARPEPYWAQW